MISKINVAPIIKGHFDSFKDRDGKFQKIDLFGFYIIPSIVAGYLLYCDFGMSKKNIDILIIAQTIFVPLLINVLVIVYGLIDGIKRRNSYYSTEYPNDKAKQMRDLKKLKGLRELFGNISYTVLISGLCLCALGLYNILRFSHWFSLVDRFFAHFFIIHLILTFLMIIKRFHLLLSSEFENE